MPVVPAPDRRRLLGWMPWAIAAALPPLVLALVRAGSSDDARWWFVAGLLYWSMPAVVLFALAAGIVRWRAAATPWRVALRRWLPGAVAAVVLTGALFLAVPPTMRVQFDETSLVNTSLTMHRHRAAMMTVGAVPFEGDFVGVDNTIDKRPPLFSFLASVLHDVTGPRVANAFVLNAMLLTILLFAAFAAVRERLGLAAAFAAQMLLLAVPLTTIVATSAGFDLLAATLFAVTLLAAHDFGQQPTNARFVAFLGAGMLFAQSRYESLFAFVLLFALVAWRARGHWRPSAGAKAALALCPLLVTPLLFLLEIARNPNFYPEAGGAPLVGWTHFAAHVGPWLREWFRPALDNPLPGVVGIAALATWIAVAGKRAVARPDFLLLLPLLAVTGLVMCWFSGGVDDPIALRLYLPFACFTALSPLAVVGLVGRRAAPWLLAAAAGLAAWRTAEVANGRAFPPLAAARVVAAVEGAIGRSGVDARTTLWVTTMAQHLVTTGRAAVCPMAFAARVNEIGQLVAQHEVHTICVIETPFDEALAGGYGHPRDVLGSRPRQVLVRADGDVAVTVLRLR